MIPGRLVTAILLCGFSVFTTGQGANAAEKQACLSVDVPGHAGRSEQAAMQVEAPPPTSIRPSPGPNPVLRIIASDSSGSAWYQLVSVAFLEP